MKHKEERNLQRRKSSLVVIEEKKSCKDVEGKERNTAEENQGEKFLNYIVPQRKQRKKRQMKKTGKN